MLKIYRMQIETRLIHTLCTDDSIVEIFKFIYIQISKSALMHNKTFLFTDNYKTYI